MDPSSLKVPKRSRKLRETENVSANDCEKPQRSGTRPLTPSPENRWAARTAPARAGAAGTAGQERTSRGERRDSGHTGATVSDRITRGRESGDEGEGRFFTRRRGGWGLAVSAAGTRQATALRSAQRTRTGPIGSEGVLTRPASRRGRRAGVPGDPQDPVCRGGRSGAGNPGASSLPRVHHCDAPCSRREAGRPPGLSTELSGP